MITTEQFSRQLKTATIRHGERYDNERLAEWNHAQTHCAICGDESKCDNSHTVKKGRGGAMASQVYALPLCRNCHQEYEDTAIEIYLANHPDLFEIVTRNIEKQFDYFTGAEKHERKSTKPRQPKKDNSIFKKARDPRNKRETCKLCFRKSFPDDEVRHEATCPEFQSQTTTEI